MARTLIRSVDKAFIIIEILTSRGPELGVTEIARATDMDPGTVHRLLTTMATRNFISQNPRTRKYRLGVRFLECAASIESSFSFREVARTYMNELAAQCNETVNLTVREGDQLVYIDQVQPKMTSMIQLFTKIGAQAPLHCTGGGKALLAALPESAIDEIMTAELAPFTKHTLTSIGELKAELARVRERGFAFDDEERENGVRCVASPLWDVHGEAVAAISISGPTVRLSRQDLFQLGEQLLAVTTKISRALGWRGNDYYGSRVG